MLNYKIKIIVNNFLLLILICICTVAEAQVGGGLSWRGNSQGFRVAGQGFNTGTTKAITWRMRQYSNAPFSRLRLVISLTYPSNTILTGSIGGTTLSITGYTSGTLNIGAIISCSSCSSGTQILSQLTSTNPDGLPGREGTYQVSLSQSVASTTINGPIADTFYPYPMTFQAAFEPAYVNALSGLSGNRPLFLFGSATSVAYDPSTWDRNIGYIISDVLEAGSTISPRAPYGIWFTTELPAPAANQVPFTKTASSYINRWEGLRNNASSSQIATNFASTSTSIGAYTTSQNGQIGPFTPAMTLIEQPALSKSIAVLGDSIAYSVGEGVSGSGLFGDPQGSVLGNMGYIERGLYEISNSNEAVNLARGSDKGNYIAFASDNSKYRFQILELSNPTGIINEYGHNDISGGTAFLTRSNSTQYLAGTPLLSGSTMYWVKTSGVTGSSPPTSTTPGIDIADGQAILRVVGTGASTAAYRTGLATLAANMVINQRVRNLLNVPISQALVTPDASSTDNWSTTANQTPRSGWGDATSARGVYNAATSLFPGDLAISRVINPNSYVEGDSSTTGVLGSNTSKWYADTTQYGRTADGIHPNSHGHYDASQSVNSATIP